MKRIQPLKIFKQSSIISDIPHTRTFSTIMQSPNKKAKTQEKKLVTLKYEDLVADKDLSEQLYEAYGPNGLGALTVSGIPNFSDFRQKLLPLSHKLAHQPDEVKSKLEHEPSMWNAGWSHGKEKLGDKPDFAKGSFYANPLYDLMATPEEVKKYPFFYPENIWPKEDMPEVEPAFKALGSVMYDVVLLLCKQVDRLTKQKLPTYEEGSLYKQISQTKKIKGRLLYYYPLPEEQHTDDGWIGWHNDSGFLTALTSAMFFDDKTGQVVDNPDPDGGLWIVDRESSPVRVRIPADHLAIQCGEWYSSICFMC